MRRPGVLLVLLALAACGSDEPAYADGEEVARRVLACQDDIQTEATLAGPVTTCLVKGGRVQVVDWGEAGDTFKETWRDKWSESGHVGFDVGGEFTVFVDSRDSGAVKSVESAVD